MTSLAGCNHNHQAVQQTRNHWDAMAARGILHTLHKGVSTKHSAVGVMHQMHHVSIQDCVYTLVQMLGSVDMLDFVYSFCQQTSCRCLI